VMEAGAGAWSTPLPLLTTRGGLVPHLIKETLALLPWSQGAPVIAPLQHHIGQGPLLEKFGGGLAAFLGMEEHPLLLTLHDPTMELRSGYNRHKSVSVWQFGSNQNHVDPQAFMEVVEQIRPSAFLALCDGDTRAGCSNKRVSHAVAKTVEFTDSCLARAAASPALAATPALAAVEGGLDLKGRRKSAREAAARPAAAGFLLDGFHHGPDGQAVAYSAIAEAVAEVIALLPADKPRYYLGPAHPALALHLVSAGVDVFDTSYPTLVTERDAMLVFPNTLPGEEELEEVVEVEASLEREEFRTDLGPLVAGCTCYTCSSFTRAYLHHLVTTREMLARVLLALHNLHHYHTFFLTLQASIEAGTLDRLARRLPPGHRPPVTSSSPRASPGRSRSSQPPEL